MLISRSKNALPLVSHTTRFAPTTQTTTMTTNQIRHGHIPATPQDIAQSYQYSRFGLKQRVSNYFYKPQTIRSRSIQLEEHEQRMEELKRQSGPTIQVLVRATKVALVLVVSTSIGFSLATAVASWTGPIEGDDD